MILAEHHIDFTYHGLALINALALAKVMLLVRHTHLGDQLKKAAHLSDCPEVGLVYHRARMLQNSGRCCNWFLSP